MMGKNCNVLDAPGIVSDKLVDYLNRHPEIEGMLSKNGEKTFYTTDDSERFKSFGEKFLGQRIPQVEFISL